MLSTNIMIVEDERIVAMDIKSSLENLGYTVTAIASSGEAALKKVAETQPELVLMDIQLKGDMDGVETAKEIRKNFNIPVIYLTANADNTTLQRAKITEPYGYILKPFEEKELNISIEMALYKHQKESQVKASEQWFATTLKSIGDAAIAIDNNNSLVFINTVAESLTDWKQEDALGKKLTDVFNIPNEETRSLIASLVTKATSGVVISLPEDTTLLTKTGKLIPIAGSAAAIRDNKGNINGTIFVFRTGKLPAQQPIQTKVGNSSRTAIDDITLIQTFVNNFIQGGAVLLHNPNLKTEHVGDTIQLLGKTEGLVVKGMLTEKTRSALVKRSSRYWELVHQAMFANSFFPVGQIKEGVYRYQHRPMPENYQIHCTEALNLWQVWLEEKNRNQRPGIPMDIIMLRQGTWTPIMDMTYNSYGKTLDVKTIGGKVTIDGAEMLIWGKKLSS